MYAHATVSAAGSLYAPVRPEFCVLVRILRCDSLRSVCLLCGVHSVRSVYVSVRAIYLGAMCACSISLRVLLFLCVRVAYSRVFPSAMYSCILCCDPMLCLSPMWYSFCALYVSMRAIYFSTMCACSISFRVLIFLVLCEAYSCVFLCYIPCIPAYIL